MHAVQKKLRAIRYLRVANRTQFPQALGACVSLRGDVQKKNAPDPHTTVCKSGAIPDGAVTVQKKLRAIFPPRGENRSQFLAEQFLPRPSA